MTPSADDAFDRLEKLIADAAEPFDILHVAARRLVLRATKGAPASYLLSIAIDEFHAELLPLNRSTIKCLFLLNLKAILPTP